MYHFTLVTLTVVICFQISIFAESYTPLLLVSQSSVLL